MRLILLLMVFAVQAPAQSIFVNGSLSSIITPGSSGGGTAPGDGYEANLYGYWKFDSAVNPEPGSVGSRNLGNSGCDVTTSGHTGFIGNCINLNCQLGTTDGCMLSRNDDGSGDFHFTGSFSVRFWFKTSLAGARNTALVSEFSWSIYLGSPPVGVDGKIDFYMVGDIQANHDLVSTQDVCDGAWHYIVAWFDAGTGTMGLQIDNNSPSTHSPQDIFDSGADALDISQSWNGIGTTSDTVLIDELAIWKGYALTASDITFDYNSGSGRTYPLP